MTSWLHWDLLMIVFLSDHRGGGGNRFTGRKTRIIIFLKNSILFGMNKAGENPKILTTLWIELSLGKWRVWKKGQRPLQSFSRLQSWRNRLRDRIRTFWNDFSSNRPSGFCGVFSGKTWNLLGGSLCGRVTIQSVSVIYDLSQQSPLAIHYLYPCYNLMGYKHWLYRTRWFKVLMYIPVIPFHIFKV